MKRKHLGLVQARRPLPEWARSGGFLMRCCPQCHRHQTQTQGRFGEGEHRSAGAWQQGCSTGGGTAALFFPFLSKTQSDISHFLHKRAPCLGRELHQCFGKDLYRPLERLQRGCVCAGRPVRQRSSYSQLTWVCSGLQEAAGDRAGEQAWVAFGDRRVFNRTVIGAYPGTGVSFAGQTPLKSPGRHLLTFPDFESSLKFLPFPI